MRPQKSPTPKSQIAEDVLKQTEMIYHDVRKNTMQAYLKYKAYNDKKNKCLETQGTTICVCSTDKSR